MTRPLPRALWIALEQAALHDLTGTAAAIAAGEVGPVEGETLLHAYGRACAERAHDLGRRAAEHRARLRARSLRPGVGA